MKIISFALLSALAIVPARAAEKPLEKPASPHLVDIPCEGTIAILYRDKIKPGGTVQGFVEATAAHQAWYRAQGITENRFVVAKVVKVDEKTGKAAYAEDEVYNLHINPPAHSRYPKRGDAAWKAFVAKYEANSQIIEQRTICLPKF